MAQVTLHRRLAARTGARPGPAPPAPDGADRAATAAPQHGRAPAAPAPSPLPSPQHSALLIVESALQWQPLIEWLHPILVKTCPVFPHRSGFRPSTQPMPQAVLPAAIDTSGPTLSFVLGEMWASHCRPRAVLRAAR